MSIADNRGGTKIAADIAASSMSEKALWNSATQHRRLRFRRLISGSHYLSLLLGKAFPNAFPFFYVIGYPKSGTSWAAQLVAECLDLPHPQNSLFPIGFPAVIQSHCRHSSRLQPAVYVLRDGRDVMVSLYFHLSGQKQYFAKWPAIRGLGDAHDIRRNLPEFIRGQAERPHSCRCNWEHHVISFLRGAGARTALLRYEDIHNRTRASVVLQQVLQTAAGREIDHAVVEAALDKYSFQRLSGRSTGCEDPSSHLRKGQTGDWRNHFTTEAAEAFSECFGSGLISAGYETDASWVRGVQRASAA